jgi:hypothetical protein
MHAILGRHTRRIGGDALTPQTIYPVWNVYERATSIALRTSALLRSCYELLDVREQLGC